MLREKTKSSYCARLYSGASCKISRFENVCRRPWYAFEASNWSLEAKTSDHGEFRELSRGHHQRTDAELFSSTRDGYAGRTRNSLSV